MCLQPSHPPSAVRSCVQSRRQIDGVLQNEKLNLECRIDVDAAGRSDCVMSGPRCNFSTVHQKSSNNSNASAVTVLAMYKHATLGVKCGLHEV